MDLRLRAWRVPAVFEMKGQLGGPHHLLRTKYLDIVNISMKHCAYMCRPNSIFFTVLEAKYTYFFKKKKTHTLIK